MTQELHLEHDSELSGRLRSWPLASFWLFVAKEAWCALFGGLMLVALVLTKYVELPGPARYDWMFLIALLIQVAMLVTRLETVHEFYAVVCFHLTGLAMEVFKTSGSVGSWTYPGHAFFHVANVPLFSGFMYAAVGSYMARSWRVFHLRIPKYPNRLVVGALAVLIYLNFFTHHYVYDIRYFLFAATVLLYGTKMVYFTVNRTERRMPILVSFVLISSVIWLAENLSTFVGTWRYPNQADRWHLVGVGKLGSWALLMVISFVMVETMYFLRNRYLNHQTVG